MNNFHPNMPWGKGLWAHDLSRCEGGDIPKIIAKLKANDISYVLIKSADGENCYPNNQTPQLTKDITDSFHNNGIKVLSWSYVYGYNPQREAALALWSLEQLGTDGHVFDAEIEYEKVPDNVQAAEIMFQTVRAKQPNAFLAHAPFPEIKYHTRFPYVTFGKYCDAVMPQMYWGTIGLSVSQMVTEMFTEWESWQNTWIASGHGDCVKPIIPLGQGYDNPETRYVLTPAELSDFIHQVAGYGSVNFWVYEYLLRDDLWTAIRDGKVKEASAFQTAQQDNPNPQIAASGTSENTLPASDQPAEIEQGSGEQEVEPAPEPSIPNQTPDTQIQITDVVDPSTTPASTTVVAKAPIVDKGKTTITLEKNTNAPSGVNVTIAHHKPHIEYVIEFFTRLGRIFTSTISISFDKKKGGEK